MAPKHPNRREPEEDYEPTTQEINKYRKQELGEEPTLYRDDVGEGLSRHKEDDMSRESYARNTWRR